MARANKTQGVTQTRGNPPPKIRSEFKIPEVSKPARPTKRNGLLTAESKAKLKRLAHAQLNYGRGHA